MALTRAKNWLYVCYPLRYYYYRPGVSDHHGFAQRTRFLPDAVLKLFSQRQGSAGVEDEIEENHGPHFGTPAAPFVGGRRICGGIDGPLSAAIHRRFSHRATTPATRRSRFPTATGLSPRATPPAARQGRCNPSPGVSSDEKRR